MTDIAKDIEIRHLALHLTKQNTIVFSDVHLGMEESLKRVQTPLFQWEDIIQTLAAILKNDQFNQIIINGDFKEEFGKINPHEWRHTMQFIDLCLEHSEKVIIIKGNHDVMLGPIARKKEVEVLESLQLDNIFLCHGDEKIDIPEGTETIIIGHEHPAVTLHDGARGEKFKCFIKGGFKGKKIIVLPSLFSFTEGTDLLTSKPLSPFLKQDLSDFDCWIIADEARYFGKLGDLE